MGSGLKRVGFTAFALAIIVAGVANLVHAATSGEIWARRGWILYADHPFWFVACVVLSVVGVLVFAAGIVLAWRERRTFD